VDDSGFGMPQVKILAIGMMEKWNGGMMDKKNLKLEFILGLLKTGLQFSIISGGKRKEKC
jgi:hypothetical protein